MNIMLMMMMMMMMMIIIIIIIIIISKEKNNIISTFKRRNFYSLAGLPDWATNHKMGHLKNDFVTKKMKFMTGHKLGDLIMKNCKLADQLLRLASN